MSIISVSKAVVLGLEGGRRRSGPVQPSHCGTDAGKVEVMVGVLDCGSGLGISTADAAWCWRPPKKVWSEV